MATVTLATDITRWLQRAMAQGNSTNLDTKMQQKIQRFGNLGCLQPSMHHFQLLDCMVTRSLRHFIAAFAILGAILNLASGGILNIWRYYLTTRTLLLMDNTAEILLGGSTYILANTRLNAPLSSTSADS